MRNSGIQGGRFLKPQLIVKPGGSRDIPEYYTSKDFHIGMKIELLLLLKVILGLGLVRNVFSTYSRVSLKIFVFLQVLSFLFIAMNFDWSLPIWPCIDI